MIKKFKKPDPNQDRESAVYQSPIASREHLAALIESYGGGLRLLDIAKALDYHDDDEQKEALRRRLRAMVRDSQLTCSRDGYYHLVDESDLSTGEVVINRSGFAKVKLDKEFVRISPRYLTTILPGDLVQVKVSGPDGRGRPEASIVKIIERRTKHLVGRIFIEDDGCFVVPEDGRIAHEIFIAPENLGEATDEQLVLVEIIDYPDHARPASGRVISLLGDKLTAPVITESAIQTFHLPHHFPEAVLEQAETFAEQVTPQDLADRRDLRSLPFVTIDGADAKDFDDAVFCQQEKDGWRLWVAIADVSHYVRPGSALDQEAAQRGNSVYFPEYVVPMLPENLSNGLCSLKPHEDRLVMVAEIVINKLGQKQKSHFYPAAINSQGRFTYEYVSDYLSGQADATPQLGDVVNNQTADNLIALESLFQALFKQRSRRGALEFHTSDPQIKLNDEGNVVDIAITDRNIAHRLIEECMLLANVAAAEFLLSNKLPGLFRIHQGLKNGAIEQLREFLSLRQLSLAGGDDPAPHDLNEILTQAASRKDWEVIQSVVLRNLTQAAYAKDNIGHFGLAYDAYSHFTSPIRRYADLIVHRIIKKQLDNKFVGGKLYDNETLANLGSHVSITERRAEEATRDVISTLKCVYIEDKLGEELPGVVSGLTNFGMFVTLEGIFVDGLVHIASLKDDYYQYDENAHQLVGERTNRRFSLGQELMVKVAQVNTTERKVDFVLVD